MRLDLQFLKDNFDRFNKEYFEGKLPRPKFAIGKARMVLGSLNYKRKITIFGTKRYDYTIRLSSYYDQDEQGYLNVLLHEMIHYYIDYNRISDTSVHGIVFRKMMNQLNRNYGWKITVSTKIINMTEAVRKEPVSRLVLAAISQTDDYYLSVVSPYYARKVDTAFHLATNIKSYTWFIAKDEYFSNFRMVRSPRARKVSKQLFYEKIKTLTPYILP